MYHSIADNPDDPCSVTVDAFRSQISWLSENGFAIVSLLSLFQTIQAGNFTALRNKVVITFDDGCKDFVTNAFPVLLDYKAPATVFLVTEMLGQKSSWNEFGMDVPLMTVDEVQYIKAHGIGLGSHAATHVNLAILNPEELRKQLEVSRDRLTSLGESFHVLSYPWGQWSRQVAESVKSCGYECALAVGEQTRFSTADIYCLPRITMSRCFDSNRFEAIMSRTRVELELRRQYRRLREMINRGLNIVPEDSSKNKKTI